jgi:NAD(P)-dependent dehydrogenase (short-subunit alcohol dehydrogenase family)
MRNVIVTGAAGGIGQAICRLLQQSEYRVIGLDRARQEESNAWERIQFDIEDLKDQASAGEFSDRMGDLLHGELTALINNAAVQVLKPVEKLQPSDWMQSLDVNLLAPFWLVQMLLPFLRKSKGSVVNIASIHAQLTKSGFTAYSTTKGALVALTRALALELAPDVRVNAILPAATDTAMLRNGFNGNQQALKDLGSYHPLGRIAHPEEVAALALFLVGSQSSFLTGEAIRVDGGIGAVLHDPGARSVTH